MILSILDNDLYKFTMQQAVHMLYPRAQAEYEFINRGDTVFPDGFAQKVRQEIERMARLSSSQDQKAYLEKTCYFLTPVYLDYLKSYRFNPEEVSLGQEKGCFFLKIKGPWYRTILWEVPLMAIISETFFSMTASATFSRKYTLPPIGTLAHEWFMFHAGVAGYPMANTLAMDAWVTAFKGDLGIALTDTYTTEVFLSSFDIRFANLFDGVRQDSGDPVAFVNRLVRHYETLHIDPAAKTIIFSDGLDIDKAIAIHFACKGKIRDAYGIGTNLTNDMGVTPLNMVIKMSQCRISPERPWQHTVKLSDDKGKHTGNRAELDRCMTVLNLLPQKTIT